MKLVVFAECSNGFEWAAHSSTMFYIYLRPFNLMAHTGTPIYAVCSKILLQVLLQMFLLSINCSRDKYWIYLASFSTGNSNWFPFGLVNYENVKWMQYSAFLIHPPNLCNLYLVVYSCLLSMELSCAKWCLIYFSHYNEQIYSQGSDTIYMILIEWLNMDSL